MTLWKVLMTLFKRPQQHTSLTEGQMEKNIVREEIQDAMARLRALKAEAANRARLEER